MDKNSNYPMKVSSSTLWEIVFLSNDLHKQSGWVLSYLNRVQRTPGEQTLLCRFKTFVRELLVVLSVGRFLEAWCNSSV